MVKIDLGLKGPKTAICAYILKNFPYGGSRKHLPRGPRYFQQVLDVITDHRNKRTRYAQSEFKQSHPVAAPSFWYLITLHLTHIVRPFPYPTERISLLV